MTKALIFDIEGTITDIRFVANVLFPYARANMPEFLRENFQVLEVSLGIANVRAELKDENVTLDAVIAQLDEWMKEDVKIGALKYLQGLVWRKGYAEKAFQGHVYDEVKPAFVAYKAKDYNLYIYSSGSVEAQNLILENSVAGDLKWLISGNFDTNIGGKLEANSYTKIAAKIQTTANNCIFFSDNKKELLAAQLAGMQIYEINRDFAVDYVGVAIEGWPVFGSLNGFKI